MQDRAWQPVEAEDASAIRQELGDPLGALSRAEVPAIVLRRAFGPDDCRGLIGRFIERGLMDDPSEPDAGGRRGRIDIGTSLGNRGNDKEAFFAHAQETHALFETLFEGFGDPVATVYEALRRLAEPKQVRVAREPDGRLYGPAIFRVHYEGHRYRPHIDHVRLREKRFDYAVTRFEDQFAGVLLMQNSAPGKAATQSILHRCLWTEQVQPHIAADTFPAYAQEKGIARVRVDLEPGDLYFFNTRLIHEVPALRGECPRVVLAVFAGYSEREEEVVVWA